MSSGLISRVKFRRVESRSLVPNHKSRRLEIDLRVNLDFAVPKRRHAAALFGQGIKVALVFLAQVGAHFQIAVVQGVRDRLVKGDSDLHARRRVADIHDPEVLLDQVNEWRNQVGIVFQKELSFSHFHAPVHTLAVPFHCRDREHPFESVGQFGFKGLLGYVVGCPGAKPESRPPRCRTPSSGLRGYGGTWHGLP